MFIVTSLFDKSDVFSKKGLLKKVVVIPVQVATLHTQLSNMDICKYLDKRRICTGGISVTLSSTLMDNFLDVSNLCF